MFILEIAPLLAIPRNQSQILSYFSKENLPSGALVEIKIKNKIAKGVVIKSQPIKNLKIRLKKEVDFAIRPVARVLNASPVLTHRQLEIAFWLSFKYFAPLGLCLKTVMPRFKFDSDIGDDPQTTAKNSSHRPFNFSAIDATIKFIPIGDPENHHKDYKELISKNKNGQTLLLVPEIPHLNYFEKHYQNLKPEILHGKISVKKYREIYKKALAGSSLFLISTRLGAFLPFKNLSLIILDNESDDFSRSDTTPKYELPELARFLAQQNKAELVIGDILPEMETFLVTSSHVKVTAPETEIKILNIEQERKEGNFSMFSNDLREVLIKNALEKKNTIIFVPRLGYASLFCSFCRKTIRCSHCLALMFLYESNSENLLLRCRQCKNEEPAIKMCPNCKETLLANKGYGVQKVVERLKRLIDFSGGLTKVLELSGDTATAGHHEEEEIVRRFVGQPGAFLIGTQKIFRWPYLLKSETAVILNLELSSGFPDFRVEEKTLKTAVFLTKISRRLFVQTLEPLSRLAKTIENQDWEGFMKKELEIRRTFNYPPFSDLIKLSLKGMNFDRAPGEAKELAIRLKSEAGMNFPSADISGPFLSLSASNDGGRTWNIILKTDKREIQKRNNLLRLASSRWRIEVNPKKII